MKNRLFLFLTGCLLSAFSTFAQGPKQIAKISRSVWPYEINSVTEFDFASKMEMLVFIEVLQGQDKQANEDSLAHYLGLEKVAIPSIELWKGKVKSTLLTNFNALSKPSSHDFIPLSQPISWISLVQGAKSLEGKMPDALKVWYGATKAFYLRYIYEQMRLAALFPRVTSEILPLDNSELTGFELKDKQFLLTFDDGPTAPHGHTDRLLTTLQQQNQPAIFFILGDMFNARLKATSLKQLHDLYGANVVGSHGKVHKPHQKYADWPHSLASSLQVIDSVIPENQQRRFFRPPYGQRNSQMVSYLNAHHAQVMLWNIDSQDWNAKIASREVADRVITLMLLWRKGIILFHDIHPKANEALPIIWKQFNATGISWVDPVKL
ncbi:MAG: polysaccharide deacetylase family protein [Bacteroidota bacterium]